MKLVQNRRTDTAFSWLELLVAVVTVMLLFVVFTMILPRARPRSKAINCVNNLKQVGLAARMWSNDHYEQFPWAVSTNKEGTLEYAASAEVFRHFMAMSNELSSPKVLACPADHDVLRAASFTTPLANENISYFIGLEADETRPQTILSGDRNIIGGTTNGALLVFGASNAPAWTRENHNLQGNLGLGDGSVQQMTTPLLARQFQAALASQTNPVISLAIPLTPAENSSNRRLPGISAVHVVSVTAVLAVLALWLVIRRGVLAAAADDRPTS